MKLDSSLDKLSGIGPHLMTKLNKCGLHIIKDLLFHLPYRYQDRTRVTPIAFLPINDWAVVVGQVTRVHISLGRKRTLNVEIEDNTGLISLKFFNFNQHQVTSLKENPTLRIFGEVKQFKSSLMMVHPEYQILKETEPCIMDETLTPIYPSTQGLSQTRIRQLVKLALKHCVHELHQLEWMSQEALEKHQLPNIASALSFIHAPTPDVPIHQLEQGTHPAIQRIVFDELLAQRISLRQAKAYRESLSAPSMLNQSSITSAFMQQLSFELTNAQWRVFQEISNDLEKTTPMFRLVQGDVGCGKTVIAALAALQAISNGFQVALMAPTDLLSEQHAINLTKWFSPLGFLCDRLTGKMGVKARREVLERLTTGNTHILIGTHALFQDAVQFHHLGLIIIDEQHRFGVEQRLKLQEKGQTLPLNPHQLLLTATPIPRTLAMSYFSHLDVSIIDELPPGRTPIQTAIIPQQKRESVIERLSLSLSQGKQAYWVCTLIEESETLQCQTATDTAELLKKLLPNFRIGLVHGRLKAQEKDMLMTAFKAHEIDLLVATTVIEVGVDVPNACIMVIENSERLGLSQLHQLRGRVGRGQLASHCLLMYQNPLSEQGMARLKTIRDSTDGFVIAEKDLALRGYGDVLGKQQTGYKAFKMASLPRDEALLPIVAHEANYLLSQKPHLAQTIVTQWLGDVNGFIQS